MLGPIAFPLARVVIERGRREAERIGLRGDIGPVVITRPLIEGLRPLAQTVGGG